MTVKHSEQEHVHVFVHGWPRAAALKHVVALQTAHLIRSGSRLIADGAVFASISCSTAHFACAGAVCVPRGRGRTTASDAHLQLPREPHAYCNCTRCEGRRALAAGSASGTMRWEPQPSCTLAATDTPHGPWLKPRRRPSAELLLPWSRVDIGT